MGLYNCNSMGKREDKVIILAADSISLSDFKTPRCLVKTGSGKTILQRQIETLLLYNYDPNNIHLVIGTEGPWMDINEISFLKNFNINIISNSKNKSTNSVDSFILAFNEFSNNNKNNSEIIIIYSDILFDTSHLDSLYFHKNTMLVKSSLSISEGGIKLDTNDKFVKKFDNQKTVFPWKIFAGIIKISQENKIKNILADNINSNLVNSIIDNINKIEWVDVNRYVSGNSGVDNKTFDLAGGSFARLEKKLVVKKGVLGEGAEKLINEILWLKKYGDIFPDVFPKVVSSKIEKNDVWYEMPFFDLPNLRKSILTSSISQKKVESILIKILDFVFENLYNQELNKTPKDFIKKKHFDRIYFRLFEVYDSTSNYKKLIESEKVFLNNEELKNLPELFFELISLDGLEEIVNPKYLVNIHGDLHFQNILMSEDHESFILADPRGEIEGSDLYYDMGKLWHSVNGLYDFIHTNQFTLKSEFKNGYSHNHIEFINPEKYKLYKDLEKFLEKNILSYKTIDEDKYYMEKILFNEAIHFCSVMTFHLNRYGDELRSTAMYLSGIKLLNDFLKLDSIKSLKTKKYNHFNLKDQYDFINRLKNN